MSKKVPLKLQAAHASFEEAREALIAFRAANPKLMDQYDRHVQSYNEALNTVKDLYRANAAVVGDSYNDFSVRYKTEIDAVLLIELMGESVKDTLVQTKYVVDRKEYNRAVADHRIPQDVIDLVETSSDPSVYGPKGL